VAYFRHLMGYDAGFTGYSLGRRHSLADMATFLKKAPTYFDKNAGMRFAKGNFTKPAIRRREYYHSKISRPPAIVEPFSNIMALGM